MVIRASIRNSIMGDGLVKTAARDVTDEGYYSPEARARCSVNRHASTKRPCV